ncbi:MAG: ABC transporter ATP-binding protein [Bacillota bacterium]
MSGADVALRVEELQASYGRLQVLYGVSLAARVGACTVILGPNGAGKSSLFRAIFGQMQLLGGRVTLQAEEVTGLRARELVRRGMVFVPQGRTIFPSLSVQENLVIGRRAADLGDVAPSEQERVLGWFPVLRERLGQRAGTLSGGEQQMLAIARALLTRPRVLLVDEPTLGLAPMVRKLLFETIRGLVREGITVVMVEQNAREALAVADYAYVLEMGRNRLEGEGRAMLGDPRLEKLYLGGSTEKGA